MSKRKLYARIAGSFVASKTSKPIVICTTQKHYVIRRIYVVDKKNFCELAIQITVLLKTVFT